MLLSLLFFFPKMTQLFPGFCLRIYGVFITTYHHSNATSKNLLGSNEVYSPLPLHPYHSITTPELICIFATHSNATPVSHSVATPTPLLKYTPLPLHYYHSNATLTEHSNATPECPWSVDLHICDALLYHSNATLIPLRKVGSGIVVYTPVYRNSALHRHSKVTLLPLRQGKGYLTANVTAVALRDLMCSVPDYMFLNRIWYNVFSSLSSFFIILSLVIFYFTSSWHYMSFFFVLTKRLAFNYNIPYVDITSAFTGEHF